MKNRCTCDHEKLDSFLRGELSASEESSLTEHLSQCDTCGKELESRAAEPTAWSEAGEMLAFNGKPIRQLQRTRLPMSQSVPASWSGSEAAAKSTIENVLDQLAPTDDPQMLGRIGGYEVSGIIGAGGMGVVLKAVDPSLDRIVAIKVMSPHLASSGSARKRFARESKAAAAVLHPNVVAIHSVCNDQSLPCLVMPFLRGQTLQKRIDDHGPLPLNDILRIGIQISAGLSAAHAQGLVHRDVKPANVLLEDGVERVTVTDFGLARAVDDASVTRSGVIAGTPLYMSPEQARGEPIDARSDLFSLGSVLYTMATGRPPFRSESTFGVLRRITDSQPRPLRDVNPDIPDWFSGVIEKLHSKNAGDRFQTAEGVCNLLESCLAHVQNPSGTPLPPEVSRLSSIPSSSTLVVARLMKGWATLVNAKHVVSVIAIVTIASTAVRLLRPADRSGTLQQTSQAISDSQSTDEAVSPSDSSPDDFTNVVPTPTADADSEHSDLGWTNTFKPSPTELQRIARGLKESSVLPFRPGPSQATDHIQSK